MRMFLRLIVLFAFFSAPMAHGAIIVVDAKANSTSGGGSGFATGIHFTLGEYFEAEASVADLWSAGPLPRWSNADGLTGNLYATGSDESGEAAGTLIGIDFGLHNQHGLSLAFGTLVGSIDNNFFAMGTSFAGNAIATGELKLWYWDSNNFDNEESIRVRINKVPEPGILMLFSAGLFALLFFRRRTIYRG